MNRVNLTAPSAPLVENQGLVGHHGPPPPSYDASMGQGQFVPPMVHPQFAPYPNQNSMGPAIVLQPVPPPQQFSAVHTTAAAVIVTAAVPLGPDPVRMRCRNCNMDIVTTTESEVRSSAHICCIVMFLLGCGLCSCIPYCMDSFRSVSHSCPNCRTFLGQYKP